MAKYVLTKYARETISEDFFAFIKNKEKHPTNVMDKKFIRDMKNSIDTLLKDGREKTKKEMSKRSVILLIIGSLLGSCFMTYLNYQDIEKWSKIVNDLFGYILLQVVVCFFTVKVAQWLSPYMFNKLDKESTDYILKIEVVTICQVVLSSLVITPHEDIDIFNEVDRSIVVVPSFWKALKDWEQYRDVLKTEDPDVNQWKERMTILLTSLLNLEEGYKYVIYTEYEKYLIRLTPEQEKLAEELQNATTD